MTRLLLIAGVMLFLVSCTSPGIQKTNNAGDIYNIQGDYYLKKIYIEGTTIFLRCDANGNIISGPVAIHYNQGKSSVNVSIQGD